MSDQIQRELSPKDRFLQTAQDEMAEFERREAAFRKREREQRAALLRLPLNVDVH